MRMESEDARRRWVLFFLSIPVKSRVPCVGRRDRMHERKLKPTQQKSKYVFSRVLKIVGVERPIGSFVAAATRPRRGERE